MEPITTDTRPPMQAATRLVLFAVALALVFGLAWVAGSALDPFGLSDVGVEEHGDRHSTGATP